MGESVNRRPCREGSADGDGGLWGEQGASENGEARGGAGICFFVKQKTAYEILAWLEFRRVLFRSLAASPLDGAWREPARSGGRGVLRGGRRVLLQPRWAALSTYIASSASRTSAWKARSGSVPPSAVPIPMLTDSGMVSPPLSRSGSLTRSRSRAARASASARPRVSQT